MTRTASPLLPDFEPDHEGCGPHSGSDASHRSPIRVRVRVRVSGSDASHRSPIRVRVRVIISGSDASHRPPCGQSYG